MESSAKQKHDGFGRKQKEHGNLILADIFIRDPEIYIRTLMLGKVEGMKRRE